MGLNSSKVVELIMVINVKVAVIIGTSQDFYNDVIQTKQRKEMFYLMTYSTHFMYGYMVLDIW